MCDLYKDQISFVTNTCRRPGNSKTHQNSYCHHPLNAAYYPEHCSNSSDSTGEHLGFTVISGSAVYVCECKAAEMDSIMVGGGLLKWQRRASDRPWGAVSQGHVSLAQSDLVAVAGTAEQRGQWCCFMAEWKALAARACPHFASIQWNKLHPGVRQAEHSSHSLGCTARRTSRIRSPYFWQNFCWELRECQKKLICQC